MPDAEAAGIDGVTGVLLRTLAVGGLVYLGLLAALYFVQARMLFLPTSELVADPGAIGLAFEDVEIDTRDGERLHAWWVPHAQARGTLLFAHGNAGNVSYRLDSLRLFHRLRLNVLIFDYRGYGRSTGRPTEAGLYRDGEAARRWLTENAGVDADDLVLFGRSMGAAVAARLATGHRAACLIAESAFTSVPDRAAEIYWWLPVRWLLHIRMDTRRSVGEADLPVLVVHSRDDEIVPFSHARRLLEAAGRRGQLLEISGDHNTGFLASAERYVDGLDDFLGRCLGDG
jgi:hypothetical protein